ncbi:MAG TPA: XRE family transcriptional regulator [Devosia sp.]|nr:XRE family transcriptional regulator [Devosia sp.]
MRAPIGMRIRNQRKSAGLTQAGLARAVNISASYLNLIESNKRHVGGVLLQKIAEQLGVDLLDLTGESEQRLISELQEAFVDPLLTPLKLGLEDAHRLVAQFPEGARALHTCFRGYLDAEAALHLVSNRLKSDPLFSKLLHQMLSQITAVRSAAEILKNMPDIPADARRSFSTSIYSESVALSDAARTLIARFDQEAEKRATVTPAREVNDLIIGENNFFPDLEAEADRMRSNIGISGPLNEDQAIRSLRSDFGVQVQTSSEATPTQPRRDALFGYDEQERQLWFKSYASRATLRFQAAKKLGELSAGDLLSGMVADGRLSSPEAREMARGALASYLAGALMFPYDSFLVDAEKSSYDLDLLAHRYGASFEQVAHRLVTLRKRGAEGIPFGFLRADPAGYLSKQFPLPGLLMPNSGHACPLWAIYGAFRNPETVTRQVAGFTDGSQYLFVAKASAKRIAAFGDQPVLYAVMLACDIVHADKTVYARNLGVAGTSADTEVGPSCRLCVRQNCAHRQEPMASTRN